MQKAMENAGHHTVHGYVPSVLPYAFVLFGSPNDSMAFFADTTELLATATISYLEVALRYGRCAIAAQPSGLDRPMIPILIGEPDML